MPNTELTIFYTPTSCLKMFNKRHILDFLAVLALASFVFLTMISKANVGLWEPWETSTLLAAQQMAHSSIIESSFWSPQLDGIFVAQPCLQMWILAGLLHIYPDPGAFLLRLPAALAGIFLVLLTFLAVRQASTRRAAYVSVAVLLTLPMFVLSGKFIHGNIWLLFAVAVPNLLFILASYATTRRMHRAMLSLASLSAFTSFLSGGFFALTILAIEGLLSAIFLWHHPRRREILKPLGTKYFLVPLYIACLLSLGLFGAYATNYRYALENRMPMTLTEINRALDEDRIVEIERRQNQIIGTVRFIEKLTLKTAQKPFVLVESKENLNTNAETIFNLNESEKRAFENYLMWRFQKKIPAQTNERIPPMEGAFKAAFHAFWHHSNNAQHTPKITLAQVSADVISANPDAALVQTDDELFAPAHVKSALRLAKNALNKQKYRLEPGSLVQILNENVNDEWTEIKTGDGKHGYVKPNVLIKTENEDNLQWTSWIDILLYGLLPWGSFFPIVLVCLFISAQKLTLAPVFVGEFNFTTEQSENRSPLQILLLSWLIASAIALFIGINHNQHDIFVGLIPYAFLCGIGLTSSKFWNTIRESLEARFILILIALLCIAIALMALQDEPFRLVRYLLNDPQMHWDSKSFNLFEEYPLEVITFVTIFVIFCIIAFTGAAETVQAHVVAWRKSQKPSPHKDVRTPSSASLMRISRVEYEHIPYAPVITLIGIATLSAAFIYFVYVPSVTEKFTETELIESYFSQAVQSEPIYLVSGENAQLCNTYRDCDPGYVCQNAKCQISTFASYSLNVAKPVTRQNMLNALSPDSSTQPAFYIIPKDMLFEMNQAYRQMFPTQTRKNLHVVKAPSSRLYLIANHADTTSANPLDQIFIQNLPEYATQTPFDLDDTIAIEGFKLDQRLNLQQNSTLYLTIYYRIKQPITTPRSFDFSIELPNRKIDFVQPLLGKKYDLTRLLPGDLIADSMTFELSMMPARGVFDISVASSQAKISQAKHHLTTIDY